MNHSTSKLEKKLTQEFMGNIISQTCSFSHAGNVTACKIMDIIRGQQWLYPIGFVRIVGTFGKPATTNDTAYPAYELIIYINQPNAALGLARNLFGELLHSAGFPNRKVVCNSKYSIQLKTKEGFSLDLILANNNNFVGKAKKELHKGQQEFKKAFENLYKISSQAQFNQWAVNGLQNLDFIYTQPEVLKYTIILAKYWDVEVQHTDYIPGRCCIIELMVIHANKGKRQSRVYKCFRRFLEAMQDLKHVTACCETYYNASQIPKGVLQANAPNIMDPLSPYHNFGHGLRRTAIVAFQKSAGETLKKWEAFEKSGNISDLFLKSTLDA